MRTFTILLTIATLLACPYGCLGEAGGGTSAVSASPSCCGRCCPPSLPAPNERPPADDDCGLACLCEGAVLVAKDVDLDPQVDGVFDHLLVESAAVATSHAGSIAFYSDEHDCCRLHGCSLRIALRSFLC